MQSASFEQELQGKKSAGHADMDQIDATGEVSLELKPHTSIKDTSSSLFITKSRFPTTRMSSTRMSTNSCYLCFSECTDMAHVHSSPVPHAKAW